MKIGDTIRDGETGATGRVVLIFADGAWAKRWVGCYRCDAVDPAVGGYSDFLGGYDRPVYLIEHADRSVALVREHAASAASGWDRSLPPPTFDHHQRRDLAPPPRARRRSGPRPKAPCATCGGSGAAPRDPAA